MRWSVGAAGRALGLAVLLVGLVPSFARGQANEEVPLVAQVGSHEQFAKLLGASRAESFSEIVALYDEQLKLTPDAAYVAVERCRFITSVAAEDEEYGTDTPATEACAARLEEKFPNDGAVLSFEVERLWGEEAVTFGLGALQRAEVVWTDAQRMQVLEHLAWAYHSDDKPVQAAAFALEARKFGKPDVSMILAAFHDKRGQRNAAVVELMRPSEERSYADQKVRMLIALDAFDEALAAIAALEKAGQKVAPLEHAEALEGAGRTQEARRKYGEVVGQQWSRKTVLRRLFYLDLEAGDQAKAVSAYEAMRAEGFDTDRYLRHRLALAAAFPTAEWHLRDAAGLGGLLALYLCCGLFPLLFVVPIHYLGLVREARGRGTPGATGRWSLKHLWLVSACVLWASLTAEYAFDPGWLERLVSETSAGASDEADLARASLWGILGGFAAIAAWLRRSDYVGLVASSWRRRRILGAAIGGTLLVNGVNALVGAALRASGITADSSATAGATVTGLGVLGAILNHYGPGVLLASAVILVPFYEEVWFRSVFLGSARRYLPLGWVLVLQAAVFAAAHGEPERAPALFVSGLLMGWFTVRSGGLAPAMALHMVMNLAAAGSLIVQGRQETGPGVSRQTLTVMAKPRAEIVRMDMPALARDCDQGGVMNACHELSRRSAESGKLLRARKGCDEGKLDACMELGVVHALGLGVPVDRKRAAELYERACDGGLAASCNLCGLAWSDGHGVPYDPVKSNRLFRKACDGGHAAGCGNLGVAYSRGEGESVNQELAAELYRRGCDGGDATACSNLAMSYERGQGVAKDRAKSVEVRRRACEAGSALSCSALGSCYYSADGVAKDLREAARLFIKSCELGFGIGCHNIAIMYANGYGAPHDPAFASELFEKACNLGHADGCYELGFRYLESKGVKRDRERAAELIKHACDTGSGIACYELGRLHAQGKAVEQDAVLAERLQKHACDLGYHKACEREQR